MLMAYFIWWIGPRESYRWRKQWLATIAEKECVSTPVFDNTGPWTAIIAKMLWMVFCFVCLNQRQFNICHMESSACTAWSSRLQWVDRKNSELEGEPTGSWPCLSIKREPALKLGLDSSSALQWYPQSHWKIIPHVWSEAICHDNSGSFNMLFLKRV